MTSIPLLASSPVAFPNPEHALDEPDGLVAAGGDLTTSWLIEAYGQGIFPWFDSDDEHILWWSPAKRAVMRPGEMRVPRSLAKRIRNSGFALSMDTAFEQVMDHCSKPRASGDGTWITAGMKNAYLSLHNEGYAHSVEVWHDQQLCGGLYGVSLGQVFCGESMFAIAKDASKIAFHALQDQLLRWQFTAIDCQIMNPHLASLGVREVPRADFLQHLSNNADVPTRVGRWCFD